MPLKRAKTTTIPKYEISVSPTDDGEWHWSLKRWGSTHVISVGRERSCSMAHAMAEKAADDDLRRSRQSYSYVYSAR